MIIPLIITFVEYLSIPQRVFIMARTKEFDENTILTKAMNLFWCKGYNATSAQDLVDGLGISRSSLYDTFGDKHNLFVLSLKEYRKQMAGGLIEMIENSTNAEKTIKQIFQVATTETLEDKLQKGCFMVNSTIELAASDREIAKIVNENMQDIENALCSIIKKGQDEGQFNSNYSALSLSRFLFNTISGIRVASKSGADKKVYDDIVKVTLSVLK